MTNPGLPPRLSQTSQDVARERTRSLKENLDLLLAEVDDVLAAKSKDGVHEDRVPHSRQNFNQQMAS